MVQVARVEQRTPSLLRVTLTGPELTGYESRGPAEHIRLFYPQDGLDKPVMPEWTDDGPVMQEGLERPISRVYTPLRFDAGSGELDVDIVLHPGSDGPGSRWATAATPGQWVVVAGPAGPYRLDTSADRFVIAGDHAALPAISTVLAALPDGAKAEVLVEVESDEEAVDLESPAEFSVRWLSTGHDAAPGAALKDAIAGVDLPEGARVFVACEAAIMREIRRHLLYERNLPKEHMHTHGYWKHGEANHPDHDLGDDV
jgi:NADPH-dependent ferric siderophore reductase